MFASVISLDWSNPFYGICFTCGNHHTSLIILLLSVVNISLVCVADVLTYFLLDLTRKDMVMLEPNLGVSPS